MRAPRARTVASVAATALLVAGLLVALSGASHAEKALEPEAEAPAAHEPEAGAHGAAAGAHGEGAHHGMNFEALIVQALGFTILVVLLGKFAVPVILRLLRGRQERIRTTFDELEGGVRDLDAKKSDLAARLRTIENEAEDRKGKAFVEGAALRESLVAEGEETAVQILSKAKLEGELEHDAMLIAFRKLFVSFTFDGAEAVVRDVMDEKTQDALVDRFLDAFDDAAPRMAASIGAPGAEPDAAAGRGR